MTQSEFDILTDKFEETPIGEENKELAKQIEEARDTDSYLGVYFKKEDGEITIVNVQAYTTDECSPDGVSFFYDVFTVQEGGFELWHGGCYWGYVNAREMLISNGVNIDEMTLLDPCPDFVSEMIFHCKDFDYYALDEVLENGK